MVGTIGRPRLLRRRLLCLPIGVFCGLVLVGRVHQRRAVLVAVPRHRSPTTRCCPSTWVVVVEEIVGLVVCWFLVGQYDLYLPGPRREFLRTGRAHATGPSGVADVHAVERAEAGAGYSARTGMATRTGLRGAGVGAVGVDDEAALARAVGDRHAERVEQREVLLGRTADRS